MKRIFLVLLAVLVLSACKDEPYTVVYEDVTTSEEARKLSNEHFDLYLDYKQEEENDKSSAHYDAYTYYFDLKEELLEKEQKQEELLEEQQPQNDESTDVEEVHTTVIEETNEVEEEESYADSLFVRAIQSNNSTTYGLYRTTSIASMDFNEFCKTLSRDVGIIYDENRTYYVLVSKITFGHDSSLMDVRAYRMTESDALMHASELGTQELLHDSIYTIY